MPTKTTTYSHANNAYQFFQPKDGRIRTINIAFDSEGAPTPNEVFLGYSGEAGVTRINFDTRSLQWNGYKYRDIANEFSAYVQITWFNPDDTINSTQTYAVGDDNSISLDLNNVKLQTAAINYVLEAHNTTQRFVAHAVRGSINTEYAELFDNLKTVEAVPSEEIDNDKLIRSAIQVNYNAADNSISFSNNILGSQKDHCVTALYLNNFFNKYSTTNSKASVYACFFLEEDSKPRNIKLIKANMVENTSSYQLWIPNDITSVVVPENALYKCAFMLQETVSDHVAYGWYAPTEISFNATGVILDETSKNVSDLVDKNAEPLSNNDDVLVSPVVITNDLVWGED